MYESTRYIHDAVMLNYWYAWWLYKLFPKIPNKRKNTITFSRKCFHKSSSVLNTGKVFETFHQNITAIYNRRGKWIKTKDTDRNALWVPQYQ